MDKLFLRKVVYIIICASKLKSIGGWNISGSGTLLRSGVLCDQKGHLTEMLIMAMGITNLKLTRRWLAE